MDKERIRNNLSKIQSSLQAIREELEDGEDFDCEINEVDCMETNVYELAEMLNIKEDEF